MPTGEVIISASAMALGTTIIGGLIAGLLWAARELLRRADERYADMKTDRDFWQRQNEALQQTLVQQVGAIKDGMTVVTELIRQMGQDRRGGR